MRLVASYIACSADGYIATPEGDISFLDRAVLEGEDYGYTAFMATVDTVFVGRKTYDKVASLGLSDPHPECTQVVFSRQPQPDPWLNNGRRIWTATHPVAWVRAELLHPGKDLYCDGGAEILHQILQAGLVDRWIITTVPVLLGNGIPLLDHPNRLSDFTLKNTTHYPNGVVQRTYAKKFAVEPTGADGGGDV